MLEPSLACAEMLKYVALPGETALQSLLPFQHGSLALVSIRAWLPLTCYMFVDGDLHVLSSFRVQKWEEWCGEHATFGSTES